MPKVATPAKKFVRLDNGEVVELRGYGALRGTFEIMPGIDLTKLMYE